MPMRLSDFSLANDWNYFNLGAAIIIPYGLYMYFEARRKRALLSGIPAVGHDGIFSSYLTVWTYLFDGRALVEEGCRQYPGSAFKIPTTDGWHVVLSGSQMYDSLRRASGPGGELSTFEALDDFFKARYTVSPHLNSNPYHVDVILTSLTRNIAAKLDDVRDEVQQAFQEFIPVTEDWTEYSKIPKLLPKIVVRASNRVFVGLPLCRDKDWCDLNVNFTISVAINSLIIGLFPKFLHPLIGRIFTSRRSSLRRAMKHLSSLLSERIENERNQGSGIERPDNPNDLLSWLVGKCEKLGEEWQKASIEDLSLRVLATNFGAIHSTSAFLTQGIYDIAAHPELIEPLRAEITSVIEREGGWTKSAMSKMHLLDSFLKESARKTGVPSIGLVRMVLEDFTLPNGICLPAGTRVGIAAYHTHHSEQYYPSPDAFRVERFAETEGENARNLMTTLSEDWLMFGAGKHACPGRFFAVNQLKLLIAYVLLTYDIKFSEEQTKLPDPFWFAWTVLPDSSARVLFRKRRM
ncbi:cytochrome P450 [Marasmius fiardii PR-910]|nr:cytochrome P450 [Marasmius fiardii PR-910]